MPPSAFGQANFAHIVAWSPSQPNADADEVIYVPRASMPLPAPTPVPVPPDATQAAPPQAQPAVPDTMTVALLAFRPRFDVDLEHFYFDIEIDSGAAVEPFVRLGLVRYQANAPADKRVSEPVVEWAQLLPCRKLEVTVTPPQEAAAPKKPQKAAAPDKPQKAAAPDNTYRIGATVQGEARHGDSPEYATGALGACMHFAIYRVDAHGRQTVVAEASKVFAATTRPTWTSPCLPLSENPAQPTEPGIRYFLLATEHNQMLPASYNDEPFDPARSDAKTEPVESGPRFAASVALTPISSQLDVLKKKELPALPIHHA